MYKLLTSVETQGSNFIKCLLPTLWYLIFESDRFLAVMLLTTGICASWVTRSYLLMCFKTVGTQ